MSYTTMLSTRKLATAAAAGLLLTVAACSSQGGAQRRPRCIRRIGRLGRPELHDRDGHPRGPGSTFSDRIRAEIENLVDTACKKHLLSQPRVMSAAVH